MKDTLLYLEIGPLKERNFTGISQVTAALAEQMLGDQTRRSAFFFGRAHVEAEVVEDLLRRRDGELIEWHLQRATPRPAPLGVGTRNIAVFPNRKTCRRGFHVECQIIHDLSTLLTPQFHHQDTIDYHAKTMLEDVTSNDITFCVSEATRQDVLHYLAPLDAERVVTMPIAAAAHDPAPGQQDALPAERYALVLGTIEPRKNVDAVLRYLARNPAVLQRMRFLFLGRFGWGEKFDVLLRRYGLSEAHARSRIVFPGFVSENIKNLLVRHATVLVYPSLFEGFGIPVLEGLAQGVPAVTTRSSSLPEVGGEACFYFDPFIEGDFDFALSRALIELRLRPEAIRAACLARAAAFSWEKTYARLCSTIAAHCLRMAA